MKYDVVKAGRFIARPNRFIAQVELNGQVETVHVKNTGRCRELLVPGTTVYLSDVVGANSAGLPLAQAPELECSVAPPLPTRPALLGSRGDPGNPKRKTRYDLIAVEKGDRLINMDSQAPNAAVVEWLRQGHIFPVGTEIKPEYTYGDSRFDIAAFTPELALLEVKGVTLERNGAAFLPDAPTLRGAKHLRELAAFPGESYVLFVIQMKGVDYFAPNDATDPAFAQALRAAHAAGVHILAYDCHVTTDSMELADPVEIRL